jgi:hypothetical protein
LIREGDLQIIDKDIYIMIVEILNIMKFNDQTIISIVSAICLIGLVIFLKNVLLISSDILSRDVIIYIIIYSGFVVSLFSAKDKTKKAFKYDTPLFWSILIILMTLVIMAFYAL